MPPTSGTHSDDVDSLEPLQRHGGQLIDVPPVAGESSQRATAARQVAGLSGVVFRHIIKADRQVDFVLEDVLAPHDELRLVCLSDEWAEFGLGLGGEGHGVDPPSVRLNLAFTTKTASVTLEDEPLRRW
jgi:hypothetical protein